MAAVNTIGTYNTAAGANALHSNTTGSENTATGAGALQSNTIGDYNTATGMGALHYNTVGSLNMASGHYALPFNTTGWGNTASGAAALYFNTVGIVNTATGHEALRSNSAGFRNTAIGYRALISNTTGTGNTGLGSSADVSRGDLTNATAIGDGAVVNASNKVRVGNASVTVIEGQVGFTASSDVNLKENFQPVDGEEVLGKIREFKLTSWNYIGHDPKKFRHYGPMAQDFFAAFGHDGVGTIGTDKTITSTDMNGILMIAAQALERRSAEDKKQIASLRAENAELKARLDALERRMGER